MGGFGVLHFDDEKHCFSVLSPEDLSVSHCIRLPFDVDECVYGDSCGDLLYFHGSKGKIVIVDSTTNESVVIPPPKFDPPPYEGELMASGLGFDAKSGDYKVIRHYVQEWYGETYERRGKVCDYKEFCELYQFSSLGSSWKEPQGRPRFASYYDAAVYLWETESCYWVGRNDSSVEEYLECLTMQEQLLQDPARFDGSLDSLLMHVMSFDFATERFDRFPMPASSLGMNIGYKLVSYHGLLGVLAFNAFCSEMPVELFVWKGKGRSWERVCKDVVYVPNAKRPVGLEDDRLLFAATDHIDGRSQLMVYDFDAKQVTKLDIYNYSANMAVIFYGTKSSSTDPPLPVSILKAEYDFSRKMRSQKNKGKKRIVKGKKRSVKGKKRSVKAKKSRQ